VATAFAGYEKTGFGYMMKEARTVVDGLLRVGDLATQLASCDPHGIAGLV